MNRVLITGINSYLGLNLAAALSKWRIEVHGLVRPSSDMTRVNALSPRPQINISEGGINNLVNTLARIKPDLVIHLATRYVREHKPDQITELLDSNITFGSLLLEAMVQTGVSRFINTGSYFQYYDRTLYRPLNLYAATKQAFEDVLAYYSDTNSVQALTLVLFDIYGPGDWRPKLMDAIRDAALHGKPLALPTKIPDINPIYIDDVIAAFLCAGRLLSDVPETVAGKAFAVSSRCTHSILEIITAFEQICETTIVPIPGAYLSPARAIKSPWRGPLLPGWCAETSLVKGIRKFVGGH